MEIAYIVVGILVLVVLGMWVHARMTDPEKIDEIAEREVRAETPHEHERERFNAPSEAEQNAADIDFYSRGEDNQ